jgi:arylsulfatase A-like enzyme
VGRKSPLNWGPANPDDQYTTDLLTDAACDFIKRRKDEPFFFYLAYHAPHSPFRAKKEDREKVAHLETEPQRVYAAMILAIDEGVAKVMKTLEDNGLARDTMVVFVSDNGPATGSSRLNGYREEWPEMVMGQTGPLSGHKKTLQEGGIRMPFIMSYPAGLKKGVVDDFVVTTLDLYPTFCALAGVKPPESNAVDGINLMPRLEGRMEGPRPGNLYWALGRGRIDEGRVRSGDWKLHVEHERDYTRMKVAALYNLAEDIGEKTDLAAAHPDMTARLLVDYKKWLGRMAPPAWKRGK